MDMLYDNTRNNQRYLGLNIFGFASNNTPNNGIVDLRNDTITIDAVTLYFYPAKITYAQSSFDYVISNDSYTIIVYSLSGINNTLLTKLFLTTSQTDDIWLTNFKTVSRIEKLNSQNVSETIYWNNSANVILRSQISPYYTKCHIQIQSLESINMLSMRHSNLDINISNYADFVSSTFNNQIYNNITKHLVLYNANPVNLNFINSGLYSFTNFPNYTTSLSSIATLNEHNCSDLQNFNEFNTCSNDDTTASNDNRTCTMIQYDELRSSYCDGSGDDQDFNASIQCCACGGGFPQYNNIIQDTSQLVSEMNIVEIDTQIDEDIILNTTGLYLVEIQSTFSISCTEYTNTNHSIFGYTLKDVFDTQLTNQIISGSRSFYNEISGNNQCHYKMTSEFTDIENAQNAYNYLKRILPISPNQVIDFVTITSVPFYTYKVSFGDLNSANRTSEGTCVNSMNVSALQIF